MNQCIPYLKSSIEAYNNAKNFLGESGCQPTFDKTISFAPVHKCRISLCARVSIIDELGWWLNFTIDKAVEVIALKDIEHLCFPEKEVGRGETK